MQYGSDKGKCLFNSHLMRPEMVTRLPALLLLSLVALSEGTDLTAWVDTSRVIHEVNDRFLSYTLDTYLMGPNVRWDTFDFSNRRLLALVRGLGPAYLRVGGTPADFLFFDKRHDVIGHVGLEPDIVVMTRKDMDDLVNLTRDTSARLLFEFNLQTRYGGQWDPSNAMNLLEYSVNQGYGENIDFELGNEPGFYNILNSNQLRLSGKQIGKDYRVLQQLLNKYPAFRNASIFGPDSMYGDLILKEFIDEAGDIIKAVTFHHYYFSGRYASYKDYINPFYMDDFTATVTLVNTLISRSKHPNCRLWLGEGAIAMNSGTPNVSDRFVSGFLWLEKLGRAASLGVEVVMRQDLYGHYYGLINRNLQPNPDYWLSWLHKNVVGTKVLSAGLRTDARDVRLYAHCASRRKWRFPIGSLVHIVINMNEYEPASLTFVEPFFNQTKYLYLLSPHGADRLLSRSVALNGEHLKMTGHHGDIFPYIHPTILQGATPVIFPPLTFGFVIMPNTKLQICGYPGN